MPNNVETRFTISGKDKDIVLGIMREAGEDILNAFIPIPQTYHDYDTTNYTTDHERASAENIKELSIGMEIRDGIIVSEDYYNKFKEAEEYQKNTYGLIGWYDWKVVNWGTKWDTYEVHIEGDEVYFRTAWDFPSPLFEELARKYDIIIQGHFVDYLAFSGEFEVRNKRLAMRYDSDHEFYVKYWLRKDDDEGWF